MRGWREIAASAALQRAASPPGWAQTLRAGLASGTLFLALEMGIKPLLLGTSPWRPPQMMAAIVMGAEVASRPPAFDPTVLAAAVAVHYTLSIIYAAVGNSILYRFSRLWAVPVGGLLGLTLYGINFYGFTVMFPWFAEARNWFTMTTHVAYGMAVPCSCRWQRAMGTQRDSVAGAAASLARPEPSEER